MVIVMIIIIITIMIKAISNADNRNIYSPTYWQGDWLSQHDTLFCGGKINDDDDDDSDVMKLSLCTPYRRMGKKR